MRTRAQAKNLNLSVEYNGMIPETILTDQLRIRQILINLVNNAIKFTDHGEVRILVELLQPQSSTSQLQIDVVDTGIGIPANQLDQMFEPFIQADTSSTRNYEGTGLGLTISRKLATMLGGGISAISEFGKGSTFRLTLSIGSLDGVKLVENPNEIIAVDHDENTQSSPAMSQHVPDHLDCRILLVEDGIDNQRLISTILTNTGAQVEIAENGKIAVELVSKVIGNSRLFDLILMDMQMPVMDGYEATQLLREMGYNRPIIALTAHAMAGDREKCLAAGCSDYATKPIKRIDLIQLVSTHIQRQGNALPV